MSANRRKIINITLIFFLSLFILFEGCYLLAPKLHISGKIAEFIENDFHTKTGGFLKFDNLKIKTYPNFSYRVELDEFQVADDRQKVLLSAEKPILYGKFPPLLFKRVVIRDFSAQKIYVDAIWRKDKTLGVGRETRYENYLSDLGLKFNFDRSSVDLGEHKILLFDELSSQNLRYTSDKLICKVKNNIAKLDTEAVLASGNKEGELKVHSSFPYPLQDAIDEPDISGELLVKGLDVGIFKSFIPESYSAGIKELKGTLAVEALPAENKTSKIVKLKLSDFVLLRDKKENSVFLPKETLLSVLYEKKNDLYSFEDITFSGEDFYLNVKGDVKNLKSPEFDLNISVKESKAESLLKLIPKDIKLAKHPNSVRVLKDNGFVGNVRGDVYVRGNQKKSFIDGEITVTDASFENLAASTDVGLIFAEDKVNILAKALLRNNKTIDVEGYSELFGDEYGEYSIKTSDNVDLKTGFDILYPIAEIFDINISVLPYMKITGFGTLDMWTKGTLADYTLGGRFDFHGSDISMQGVDGVVKAAAGNLIFDGKDMIFKTTAGTLNGSRFDVNGTSNVDGSLDYNFVVSKTEAADVFKMLKNSPTLSSVAGSSAIVEKISGKIDSVLHLTGKMKKFDMNKINDAVKYEGSLALYDNDAKLYGVPFVIENLNGKINFKDEDFDFDLKSRPKNSLIEYKGQLKNNKIKLNAASAGAYLSTFFSILPYDVSNIVSDEKVEFKLNYDSNWNGKDINYRDVDLTARILQTAAAKKIVVPKAGAVTLHKGKLSVKDFAAKIGEGTMKFAGTIDNFMSKNQNSNLTCTLKNIDIALLNDVKLQKLWDEEVSSNLDFYTDYKGIINSDIKVSNNKLSGKASFSDIEFAVKKNNLPVKIQSGQTTIKNNKINLNSLSGYIAESPFFINAAISDVFNNPKVKGFLTAKIDKNFVDNVINPYMTYPLKIKGASSFSIDFDGDKNKFVMKPKLKIPQEAEISYMGAVLGDAVSSNELNAEIYAHNDSYEIKNLRMLRFLHPRPDKDTSPLLLLANAKMQKIGDVTELKELNAKTYSPVSAMIFNVLFKKSVIKGGNFSCDISYTKNKKPLVNGVVSFEDIDMPVYNTTVKSLNLSINRNQVHAIGEGKLFESTLNVRALTGDVLRMPVVVEHFDIFASDFDTNKILDTLSQVTFSNTPQLLSSASDGQENNFSTEPIIIKKGKLEAENVRFRTLNAKNLTSQFTLVKDKLLLIRDVNFEVASGTVRSNGYYNLKNGEIAMIGEAQNVDANDITSALFDLKGQIFGALSGQMMLSTRGETDEERLQNTFGSFEFSISDGKMPKLGSLEYLLKAGNMIKSGLPGLSINHVVNLLYPFNTGEFERIHGSMRVENGKAKDIEIFSKGNNLSLYINGSYDFPNDMADVQVWGKLTNDRNNLLGPVGNVSVKTLFKLLPSYDKEDSYAVIEEIKKIPDLKNKSKEVRYFNAKVNGDMNKDEAVSKFYWID